MDPLSLTAALGVSVGALLLPTAAVLSLAVLLVMAASTSLPALTGFSLQLRILAVIVILILGTRAPSSSGISQPGSRESRLLTKFVLCIGGMLAFISIAHNEGGLLEAILGVASCFAFITLPLHVMSRQQVLRCMRGVLLVVLVASVIAYVLLPSIAVRGGRLQGLTGNANLLGFYAFLYFGLVVSIETSWKRLVGPLLLAAMVLVLSASRTSAIAVVLLIIGSAAMQVGPMRKMVGWLALTLAAAAPLLADTLTSDLGLLRQGNSRLVSWDQTVLVLQANPVSGVGLDSLQAQIASSPLRALAAGGLIAGALLLAAIVYVLRASWHMDSARIFVLAAILHSFAEGWLISLTGPIVLLFVTVTAGLVLRSDGQQNEPTASPPLRHVDPTYPKAAG